MLGNTKVGVLEVADVAENGEFGSKIRPQPSSNDITYVT